MPELFICITTWTGCGLIALIAGKQGQIVKDFDGTCRISQSMFFVFAAYGPIALATILLGLFLHTFDDAVRAAIKADHTRTEGQR